MEETLEQILTLINPCNITRETLQQAIELYNSDSSVFDYWFGKFCTEAYIQHLKKEYFHISLSSWTGCGSLEEIVDVMYEGRTTRMIRYTRGDDYKVCWFATEIPDCFDKKPLPSDHFLRIFFENSIDLGNDDCLEASSGFKYGEAFEFEWSPENLDDKANLVDALDGEDLYFDRLREVLEPRDENAWAAQSSVLYNGVVKITHVDDELVWEPEQIGDLFLRTAQFTFWFDDFGDVNIHSGSGHGRDELEFVVLTVWLIAFQHGVSLENLST